MPIDYFLRLLRKTSIRRIPDFGAGETLDCWSLGERGNALGGEAGELQNVLKKMTRLQKQGKPIPEKLRRAAMDELADVVISADLIAAQLGVDLAKAVTIKFNKTSAKIGSKVRLPSP